MCVGLAILYDLIRPLVSSPDLSHCYLYAGYTLKVGRQKADPSDCGGCEVRIGGELSRFTPWASL